MRQVRYMALLVMVLATFAAHATPAIKDVAGMIPNITTAQQVDEILGKPDKIDKGLGQMVWYYNGNGYNLAVMWDMQTAKVTKYSYTYHQGKNDEWNDKIAKTLVEGQTTVQQLIDELGTPNDMAVDREKHQLEYIYKNTIVRLRFIGGKLKDYVVSAVK